MKFLFDMFPILLFFAAYYVTKNDIFIATCVTIIATAAQVAWTWFKHRKVDTMLWVSFAMVAILGGATLLLHNKTFIMWKPTALYWFFALTLVITRLAVGKNLMRTLMEQQVQLPDPVWDKLLVAWACFFALLGALNLAVAFNFSEATWVKFKVFGGIGLMLVFVLLQGVWLSKFVEENPEQKEQ